MESRDGTIAWLCERNGRIRTAVVRAMGLVAPLREKTARLRAEVPDLTGKDAALTSRVEALQTQLNSLPSPRSVMSKALYDSERQ